MRAAWFDSFGSAKDVLQVSELETPVAGPGEVLVMEFPLWGDRDFGATEMGSLLKYLPSLSEGGHHRHRCCAGGGAAPPPIGGGGGRDKGRQS